MKEDVGWRAYIVGTGTWLVLYNCDSKFCTRYNLRLKKQLSIQHTTSHATRCQHADK
jgi:hypothetical protein